MLAPTVDKRTLCLSSALSVLAFLVLAPVPAVSAEALSIAAFLPVDHVTDGSVSYQADIQRAIDAAAETGAPLVFPPMVYAVDETGLQLRSGLHLQMTGAVFRLDENRQQDGAVFTGQDVTDVSIRGGTIVGRNDAWADGVNIRGVYITGRSARIRLHDLEIRDLTSNGIGIFGTEETPIRDVWIRDMVIDNCCNRYPDYLSGEKWEKGSQREDQGLVACYHVEDFVVAGSRFERSRSDGTHFYHCRRGQFTENKVYRAKMGGYFLEGCADVVACGNLIRDNGSRGVTIERGSTDCLLSANVITLSGREGLWAPDCVGLIVTGNIFNRNGRKPNGAERHHIWNANITINEARGDPSNSPTADYLVANNLIYTTSDQIAAIRVDANETTSAIVLRGNLLRGENRKILVEGANAGEVIVAENHLSESVVDEDQ